MNEDIANCVRRFEAAQALLALRRPINATLLFAEAMDECALGLQALAGLPLGDSRADRAVAEMRGVIDTTEIVVWDARGQRFAKAEQMSKIERASFESALERLLHFIGSDAGRRYLNLVSRESPDPKPAER